ncbi:MAG TPA: M48 family metalloprotease [Candidatus Baltobacteraceae bacterium]|jgi:STE24 endopeptidase
MRRITLGLCAGFLAGYAAVRAAEAWIDIRHPAGPLAKNPKAYGATKRALMVTGLARSLAGQAVIAFALADRLPAAIRDSDRPLVTATYNALGTLIDTILDTPIEYVERYVMERRYGLSDQTRAAWLRERAKATALGMGLGIPVIAGLLWIARRFPKAWPFVSSLAAVPVLTLLTLVAPVYLAPIFNKFERLEGPLEERLRRLAAQYGAGNADIFRFDMSRQTKKANAYVTGLLGSHRIAIADTLLEGFSDDETEFVVAHELGHYVAGDTLLSIGMGSLAATFLIFAGKAIALGDGERVASIRGLARFSFTTQLLAALVGPLLAAGSRAIERRADRFALAATGHPEWGVAAFERLRDQNLAEDEQPRWAELLISSHPSLRSRIATLREAMPQAPSYP